MGTIAQKLTYLNGTKQALKESINNLGGDITNETTFREYAQELDNIYDNLPKTTGESSNLSLTTLKGKMNIIPKGDTSQDGTPTPDTPIDIEVVTGTQEVKVENVNLLKDLRPNTQTLNGVTFTNNGNGTFKLNGTSSAYTQFVDSNSFTLPKGTYTLSGRSTSVSGATMQLRSPDGYTTITQSNTKTAFTLSKDTQVRFRIVVTANITYSNAEFEPMILSGDVTQNIPTYTPHQEQTQIVSLGDIELCKIGNYQDTIEYDVDNDKVYKNKAINKKLLSTSDTWSLNRSSNNLYQYRTKNDLLEDVITSPDPYSRPVALCNYYTKGDINGMTTQCFNIGGLKYIGITSDISTLANFNTFITNNNIYVYYVKQNVEQIEITGTLKDQIKELYNLKSYNGVTNINCSGNLSAILGVSALKGE